MLTFPCYVCTGMGSIQNYFTPIICNFYFGLFVYQEGTHILYVCVYISISIYNMYVWVYVYTYTYVRAHIHTQPHIHIDMHKHTQTYTHAPQTLADTLIHKHTCITYVYTQTHMHTQMHRHAGVHTHAGIHTHMHTQSCTQIVSPLTPRNNEPYFFTILDWSDAK